MQKWEGLGIRGQGTPKMPTSVSTTSAATSRTTLPHRIRLPRAGLRPALFAAALAVTAASSAPGRSTSGPRCDPRASPRPQRARSRRIPADDTSVAPSPRSVSSSAISAGRAEAKDLDELSNGVVERTHPHPEPVFERACSYPESRDVWGGVSSIAMKSPDVDRTHRRAGATDLQRADHTGTPHDPLDKS